MNVVLDDTKEKAKGFDKILDREQMEELAKKDLEKVLFLKISTPILKLAIIEERLKQKFVDNQISI